MDQGLAIFAASFVAFTPASIAASAAMLTARRTKTNHGKRLGTHIEDLVDWTADMATAAEQHQESDNEIREALGLARVEVQYPRIREAQ